MSSSKSNYKRAVSLEYTGEKNDAPLIGAKGDELIADEIVKIAKRFGIPVVEQPDLAQALSGLEVDQQIPEKLFEPVAVLLHELDKRFPKNQKK